MLQREGTTKFIAKVYLNVYRRHITTKYLHVKRNIT